MDPEATSRCGLRDEAVKENRVLMMPWVDQNAYQRQLADALEAFDFQTFSWGRQVHFLSHLENIDADIVHLHWPHPYYNSAAQAQSQLQLALRSVARFSVFLTELAWSTRVRSVGLVWTVHNLRAHQTAYPWLDATARRVLARMSDVLIVHSEHARREVAVHLNMSDKDKIECIPHASYIGTYRDDIDRTSARQRLGVEQDEFVFLSLGAMRPYKGLVELIDTFERIEEEHSCRLMLAGDVSEDEFGRLLSDRAMRAPRVDLRPGFIPDDELQVYFQAADAVVLPYREILTSGSALLAMSYGCPVIAPDFGHLTEIIPGAASWLYDRNDPSGLEGAMQRALIHRERLAASGRAHRARAAEFRWDDVARRTAAVYRRVLQP